MPRWWVVPALLLVGLTSCTRSVEPLPEVDPSPDVAARTSWVLSHTVKESGTIQITGGTMGHYDEASYLSLHQDADGLDLPCSVTVSAPGQGGPEMRVGEKVPTRVDGRPGFRNGAGAEGPYLMWQHDGQVWTEVSCPDDRFLDVIAEAVVYRPTPLQLPFGLPPLPAGYGLSTVSTSLDEGSHTVYLGKVVAAFGHADPDIVVSYETGANGWTSRRVGRSRSTADPRS